MSSPSTKSTFIANFIWRFAERCGAQIVSFVVSIVLARLLAPDDYGTVALVTVFTNVLQVFVDSGMGVALIQKKDADDLDFSTLFYFNIVMCSVLYAIMFFCAPFIANFYSKPQLIPLVRVISLTLVISGVKNIQQSYVARKMIFKKFFFATLGGTLISAGLGIFLAYKGFGSWALVAQQLTNATIDTIILWITVKWRPKKMFSFERLKQLFSFGWKLLASELIHKGYSNLRNLLIGKIYSSADLAFYTKAELFPTTITTNINASIDSVLLPTLSKSQDDISAVKSMTRRAMKVSTYAMAPLLIGVAACGENIISILLTDKWLPSYPFMIIFCISYLFYPINTANLNAIKSLGRPDLVLKLEVIKKSVGLLAILATLKISVLAIAISLLFASIFNQIVNAWPNKKLMNYGYLEQIKDISPGIILSLIMAVCVYSVKFLCLPKILGLVIQVLLGAIIYISLSFIFKPEAFLYIINTVKPTIKKLINKLHN